MINKNKVLFYDLGMVNQKKRNNNNKHWLMKDGIIIDKSNIGTKVFSRTKREGFYYINKKLNKNDNYEFSFTWVDGNNISPIIQIREVDNMDALTSFTRLTNGYWHIYNYTNDKNKSIVDFDMHKDFKYSDLHKNDEIKLIKKGKNIKVLCANKVVIDYDISLNSKFYIGFGGHEMGNRYTIFKQLTLKKI